MTVVFLTKGIALEVRTNALLKLSIVLIALENGLPAINITSEMFVYALHVMSVAF